MNEFLNSLSNREISILCWSGLIIVILFFANISASINLLKAFFATRLLAIYILLGLYFALIIYSFNKVGLWETSLYKDFIFWLLTTGGVLLFSFTKFKLAKDFRIVFLQIITFNIVVEFIAGTYNFSLAVEFILIPIITFISILVVIAQSKSEHQLVAKFLNKILSYVGIIVLLYVIIQLIAAPDKLLSVNSLKSFMLSPIFTILFLPVLMCIVAYSKYELIFKNINRYKFFSKKKKRKIKLAIIRYGNLNLRYLDNAHNITIWRKAELQNEKRIAIYIKKEIKTDVGFRGSVVETI